MIRTLVFMAALAWEGSIGAAAQTTEDLTELGFEQLMVIKVSTVSKRPESLQNAAAAAYVISSEDIRRSGATTIPELLRLAPGVEVARIDANKWAVTIRGFNNQFANELLVLMDGRTLYTPLFSGVFWDVQDTNIEDIDRIEVIRGPGATLWGANAVNGVINIITKTSGDTKGASLTGIVGSEEKGTGSFRYGAAISDNAHLRIYGKYFERDASKLVGGGDAADDWKMKRTGFRTDLAPTESDKLVLMGDYYDGEVGESGITTNLTAPYAHPFALKYTLSGQNLLARWNHGFSGGAGLMLQGYYDHTSRDGLRGAEERDTYDVEFQNNFSLGESLGITWGLGYRYTEDEIRRSFEFSAAPDSQGVSLYNTFVQGDLVLFPDLLRVTAGAKVEHNAYTGFEVQPSARFALTPGNRHTIWGAVSRAVRTPSRVEENTNLQGVTAPGTAANPGPLPFVFRLGGTGEYEAEELIAYEIGHRWKASPRFNLDTALYYNKYDNLGTAEAGAVFTEGTPFPTRLVLPVAFRNKMDGEAFGGEIVAKWRATSRLLLEAHYGLLKLFLHPDSDSTDTTNEQAEGASPQQQASLRTRYDLGDDWDIDANLRYVDELPALNIDAYLELDLRVAWSPWKGTEFSVVGRNLLDSAHQEFTPTFLLTDPSEVERSVYVKVTTRF